MSNKYIASRRYCPNCKSENLITETDTTIGCLDCGLMYMISVYHYNAKEYLKKLQGKNNNG